MLKSRVITAVIMLVLLLAALFLLPALGWYLLVIAMVMQGTSEWARLSELQGTTGKIYWGITLLLMLGLLWMDTNLEPGALNYPHLTAYLISAVLWLIVVPAWLMSGVKVKHQGLMMLVGWAVIVPTGLAMIDLRAWTPAPWMLLFVMGIVWVADSAAYFAGRKYGKTKLAPSISPGKTWEGVAGAILGVSIYVALVWTFSEEFSRLQILPAMLLTAWWWVVLAVMGDLFESAIKRQAGVKDSGALLPGHGGLLDRIDALTSTLPLAMLALLFHGLN
ncbi:MAG: phosphatidate cytidylyltransferase [Sideroxydans sp.]|nr:phosphatidate cytidylyltransferase [Sideroxydans sp.]